MFYGEVIGMRVQICFVNCVESSFVFFFLFFFNTLVFRVLIRGCNALELFIYFACLLGTSVVFSGLKVFCKSKDWMTAPLLKFLKITLSLLSCHFWKRRELSKLVIVVTARAQMQKIQSFPAILLQTLEV